MQEISRTNILPHLVHVFPSFGHGGVPIRIATVINKLGEGYRHTILALDGNFASQSRIDPTGHVVFSDPKINKAHPIKSLIDIRRRLVALKPDLLLTFNWGAVEWALINRFFFKGPHIHFESGFGPEEADQQIPRRVRLRRIALANIDRLVVPSQTLVAIAGASWKINKAKILHLPNGVDCDQYDCDGDPDIIPKFVRQADELILGTVAPLRAEKNLPRLLRVFAKIADRYVVRLLIAGDGVERKTLETTAAELGIADKVIFAGHVETPEKVYPLMDIFAITSDTEQMPNTVLQAMAASRPIAAVDVGDIVANLSPENRKLVVSREDEASLVEMLDRLLSDTALRKDVGDANRKHVLANYSLEKMVASYGTLFDDALNAKTR
jgi:L-malate glycosyltransferase